MCMNRAKKSKNNFFAFFLTSVAWIDSVSHMMAVLDIFQNLAVAIGHAQLNRHA